MHQESLFFWQRVGLGWSASNISQKHWKEKKYLSVSGLLGIQFSNTNNYKIDSCEERAGENIWV
jgi:hypothetical protein